MDERRGFSHFLSTLRERWWIVVLAMIVVGALAYGISLLLTPRYAATAQLVYRADDAQLAAQALSSAGTAQSTHSIASDALTLKTAAFVDRVSQATGNRYSPRELREAITVTVAPEVDVIEVRASGGDTALVADVANAFAIEFVTERQHAVTESLTRAQRLLEERINVLSPEEASSAYGIAIKQRYDDLAVLLSLGISDYSILEEATEPTSAYFPRPVFNAEMGLVAGFVLGLIIVLVLSHRDRRIKNPATLERIMELPVVGIIPLISRRPRSSPPSINPAVGYGEGNETLLEAMRMLRSNLKVSGFGESKRSVLITSVAADEGKSTLAANLAICMALAGDRVVLVDANLHSPVLHTYLGIPNDRGLGDVLLDTTTTWVDKIQAVELDRFVSAQMALARKSPGSEAQVSKFVCLTSGPPITNPSEVLESGVMASVLAELQGITDFVIVDGPSMLMASDSLVLAQSVDALILASSLGRETSVEVMQVRQMLERAEIAALGIVVSGAKQQSFEVSYHGQQRPDQDEAPT